MTGGIATARSEGTPQGGPLSPLLSNILLDDLDKNSSDGAMPSAATPNAGASHMNDAYRAAFVAQLGLPSLIGLHRHLNRA